MHVYHHAYVNNHEYVYSGHHLVQQGHQDHYLTQSEARIIPHNVRHNKSLISH